MYLSLGYLNAGHLERREGFKLIKLKEKGLCVNEQAIGKGREKERVLVSGVSE